MGLFDSFKKVAADAGAAAKKAAQSQEAAEFKRSMQGALSEAGRRIREVEPVRRSSTSPAPAPVHSAVKSRVAAAAAPAAQISARTKLLNVLASEFPQYTVYENVSPTTIGGVGRFMPYSLGVYDGDVPKLFIMLVGKSTTAHREYRWSKEQAERAGVTMINFVEHYPNEIPYIVDRLHQYL